MLADIIIRTSLWVIVISGISRTGHILFILSPAYTFSLEQIDNGLHRSIDCSSIVRGESICAASRGRDVVWLARMCDGSIVGECDSLARNPFQVCYSFINLSLLLEEEEEHTVSSRLAIVSVLQPYTDKAVKCLSLNDRGSPRC